MKQSAVPYQVPADVDQRLEAIRQRIAAVRGVPVHRVTKSGETMRYVLAMAEAAEQLHVKPLPPQEQISTS